jgi:hypothetical protein
MPSIIIKNESCYNDISEYVKPINDYSYYIYSNGSILSFYKYNVGKFLKLNIDNKGYYFFCLFKEGEKRKHKRLHRLVAEYFMPNFNNSLQIDHIDRDKTNNDISNLRLATNQENSFNRKMRKDNSSGIKGVCYNKQKHYWGAHWMVNGCKKSKAFMVKDDFSNYEEQKQKAAKHRQEMVKIYYNTNFYCE